MMGNQLPYLTFPNYENVKTRFQKKIENDFLTNSLICTLKGKLQQYLL